MENRIRLKLMGLSYNPLQDGAFAMLLAAEGSDKRIPVIIGAAEAQAIAIIIERINPPRPMTHDLFATMTHAFGVELKEVFIYGFEDGIFFAEMTFSDGNRQITLDSRTSDAVAIAIRTGAPIYTTQAILDETGIEFVEVDDAGSDTDQTSDETAGDDAAAEVDVPDYESMDIDGLREALAAAVASDNFEEAAVIRRYIDRFSPDNP